MYDFILFAFIGGIGTALMTSLIGNFILWKKMSYFGDALAHAALLGIAIALFFEISPMIGASIIALLFSLALVLLSKKLESDTILGILAQSSMAVAIILLSCMRNIKIDLIGYLFGDILTINPQDIIIIYLLAFITIGWIYFNWHALILRCIDTDLAKSQNINTKKLDLCFTILLSLIIVTAVKIVGIILITSLLIIPAASARNLSSSPIQMVLFSLIFGIVSVLLGLGASIIFDFPSGPAIILASFLLFLFTLFFLSFTKTK